MKRIFGLALVAAVALTPVVLEAQAPQAAQGHEQKVRKQQGRAPIARILEHRAQLGLSAEQVGRLEAVQQQLQAQNAPLIEQLRASGAWQENRERGARAQRGDRTPRGDRAQRSERGQRQVPEHLRPVMQQLRQNNQNAMEQVHAVLTDEQQTRLREVVQQRRGGERWSEGRGSRGPR